MIALGALSIFGFFHEQLYELDVWTDAGAARFLGYAAAWAAASGVVLWRWPGQLLRVAFAGAVLWAAWWAGPVAPLAVLYFLGSCYALGRRLSGDGHAILATLLGAGVWSLVLWVALHFPVNYWWTYAAAFAVPYAFARPSFVPPVFVEGRVWTLPLLLGLLGVNFLAALKPEISADGLSMHLALPAAVARHGVWAFDHRAEAWSLMPAGADALFTGVYLLGGEYAAKLVNFASLALTAFLVADTARRWAGPSRALLCAALFVSTPLVLLVTGSLFVENIWAALVLASVVALIDARHGVSAALAALAVTVKLIAAAFAAPLLALAFVWAGPRRWRVAALGLLALTPYLFAYAKSGNPVFPFLNAVFRSPDYYSAANFTDGRFAGVSWATAYDLTFRSARYIEGEGGAAGFQYLWLVLPAALLARKREQWAIATVAGVGTALVLVAAPNLRYLYGAMPLASVMLAWGAWVEFGVAALAANLWLLPAAGYYDRGFALFRKAEVDSYVAAQAPVRLLEQRLNRDARGEPVALFSTHATADLDARAYTDSWHSEAYWTRVREAGDPGQIAAYLRELGVQHLIGPADRRALFDVVQRFLKDWVEPVETVGNLTLFRLRDTAVVPPVPSGPLPPGTYDDRERRIEYTGGWFHDNQFPEPYERTLTYSDAMGDRAAFTFEGRAVTYSFTRASNRGQAEIWIDGALTRTLDQHSPETQWRSSQKFTVSAGVHRFEVRVQSGFVDVDSITIE